MFGHVHRLSDADYRKWQGLVQEARRKRVRVERPEVEGDLFRILRYGFELHSTSSLHDLERELAAI